jgi:signal transduction histidine kinase
MGEFAGGNGPAWGQVERLMAVMSHDLRSPLSALSVGVEALAEPGLDGDTRDRYLAAMRRAITRAERVLSDLVDVSRIAAGTLEVEPAEVSIEPLLVRAARDHETQAREAGTWIVVDATDVTPTVRGDADRLLQVLDKLLTNAMRHARGSGAITLRAENGHGPEGDTVRLWVIDHGPGIPAEELHEIFDKCWRGHGARPRGAGIGLALAKGIAEAHGGSIHVESRPGDGARFCLELPLAGTRVAPM